MIASIFGLQIPSSVFSIYNVRCPINRLRSVRADHAHVETVAQLHLQLGLPVLIGSVRRYRWRWRRRRRTAVSLTISLASGRPVFLALSRVVMVVMSGVAVDWQSGVRGLAAVGLMPGGQRRWRRLMAATDRNSVLKPGLQSSYPIRVRLSGGKLRLRMRCTAQGVTGVMRSRAAGRDPVDRRCAQRCCAIVHNASDPSSRSATTTTPSSSSSSAVTGRVVRDGQRSRAAHLARRFAVDVGEALGKGGAAMVRQEPDPTGPGARRPKF